MAAEASSSGKESMYWCVTNHAIDNVKGNFVAIPKVAGKWTKGRSSYDITYTCGQLEMGEGGGWHEQAYIEFKKKIKLDTLKNLFGARVHWETRIGTAKQAEHYAQKDMDCLAHPAKAGELRDPDGNSHWNSGTISAVRPGQRTDLESVVADLRKGMKRKELASNHSVAYVKFGRGIEGLASALDLDLEEKQPTYITRTNWIFYGPSGSGKSTAAERMMENESVFKPQKNNGSVVSFENYSGQKWIFLDDFEPSQISRGTLKEIMDNRKCVLPGRGANSSKIGRHLGVIITTNLDPEFWYDDKDSTNKVHWEAIRRRCQTVWECGRMDPMDPSADWISMGGMDKDWPAGKIMDSPLEELRQWAIDKEASEKAEAAALAGAGPAAPIDLSQEE